jgi:hypothetical protein
MVHASPSHFIGWTHSKELMPRMIAFRGTARIVPKLLIQRRQAELFGNEKRRRLRACYASPLTCASVSAPFSSSAPHALKLSGVAIEIFEDAEAD